ncbi:hypothetical protein [Caballeronia zhejiangensis]|uniref:hypothetical protein n=1 Tax=Caballeronia zhejiangensis TaxID=871203 RepID=UPI00158E3F6A|nr:hypothetical protein [Caballeronia zhejiangensis]
MTTTLIRFRTPEAGPLYVNPEMVRFLKVSACRLCECVDIHFNRTDSVTVVGRPHEVANMLMGVPDEAAA